MELGTMANLAEVIGAIIVVVGLGFAVIQLQQLKIQRRARAALEVARSFQNPEFARALRMVLSLPPDLDVSELRAKGPEFEDAAVLVSLTVEAIGVMVHRRMVSLHLVWELMGGVLLETWTRLRGWSQDLRTQTGDDKFNEWMQWLVEQLDTHKARCSPQPAHLRYADWRPRGADIKVD